MFLEPRILMYVAIGVFAYGWVLTVPLLAITSLVAYAAALSAYVADPRRTEAIAVVHADKEGLPLEKAESIINRLALVEYPALAATGIAIGYSLATGFRDFDVIVMAVGCGYVMAHALVYKHTDEFPGLEVPALPEEEDDKRDVE